MNDIYNTKVIHFVTQSSVELHLGLMRKIRRKAGENVVAMCVGYVFGTDLDPNVL